MLFFSMWIVTRYILNYTCFCAHDAGAGRGVGRDFRLAEQLMETSRNWCQWEREGGEKGVRGERGEGWWGMDPTYQICAVITPPLDHVVSPARV